MHRVLFISNSPRLECAHYIQGATSRANRLNWDIKFVNGPFSKGQVTQLLSFWNPAGCIVQCGVGMDFPEALFGNIPVVYIDRSPELTAPTSLLITQDSKALGAIAARELLSLNCAAYAFIDGPNSPFWSRERRESFEATLKLNGHSLAVWADGGRQPLEDFLSSLPKPLGVFATNDFIGEPVLQACHHLGLAIPGEVALMGVDNDELICEVTHPTLTSIQPNAESAGWMSVELLARKLEDRTLTGVHLRYAPGHLVRRQSTLRLKRPDSRVLAALEALRRTNGNISLEEIFTLLGNSRRNAEIRFKRTTGHTVLEEVHAQRIAAAQKMLLSHELRIGEIATRCGFKSEATFRRVFADTVGLSARAWQKQHTEPDIL